MAASLQRPARFAYFNEYSIGVSAGGCAMTSDASFARSWSEESRVYKEMENYQEYLQPLMRGIVAGLAFKKART